MSVTCQAQVRNEFSQMDSEVDAILGRRRASKDDDTVPKPLTKLQRLQLQHWIATRNINADRVQWLKQALDLGVIAPRTWKELRVGRTPTDTLAVLPPPTTDTVAITAVKGRASKYALTSDESSTDDATVHTTDVASTTTKNKNDSGAHNMDAANRGADGVGNGGVHDSTVGTAVESHSSNAKAGKPDNNNSYGGGGGDDGGTDDLGINFVKVLRACWQPAGGIFANTLTNLVVTGACLRVCQSHVRVSRSALTDPLQPPQQLPTSKEIDRPTSLIDAHSTITPHHRRVTVLRSLSLSLSLCVALSGMYVRLGATAVALFYEFYLGTAVGALLTLSKTLKGFSTRVVFAGIVVRSVFLPVVLTAAFSPGSVNIAVIHAINVPWTILGGYAARSKPQLPSCAR
jgi:hypothetical protein